MNAHLLCLSFGLAAAASSISLINSKYSCSAAAAAVVLCTFICCKPEISIYREDFCNYQQKNDQLRTNLNMCFGFAFLVCLI